MSFPPYVIAIPEERCMIKACTQNALAEIHIWKSCSLAPSATMHNWDGILRCMYGISCIFARNPRCKQHFTMLPQEQKPNAHLVALMNSWLHRCDVLWCTNRGPHSVALAGEGKSPTFAWHFLTVLISFAMKWGNIG